jgi:hypothetical protein
MGQPSGQLVYPQKWPYFSTGALNLIAFHFIVKFNVKIHDYVIVGWPTFRVLGHFKWRNKGPFID